MGETLIEAGQDDINSEVSSTHDIGQDLDATFEGVDVAIDFTAHHFTKEVLAAALKSNTPLVIGTTGHSDEEKAQIS